MLWEFYISHFLLLICWSAKQKKAFVIKSYLLFSPTILYNLEFTTMSKLKNSAIQKAASFGKSLGRNSRNRYLWTYQKLIDVLWLAF